MLVVVSQARASWFSPLGRLEHLVEPDVLQERQLQQAQQAGLRQRRLATWPGSCRTYLLGTALWLDDQRVAHDHAAGQLSRQATTTG